MECKVYDKPIKKDFSRNPRSNDADIILLQEVRGAEDRIYKSKGLMQGIRDLCYKYFY
jgi:exonuclease III